ncbi:DUF3617 family protein [Dechloromonas sp. ZY10]|uniref:DUF3617 domain-containing protein n=1 Tax=Dechloromonas aquae TaxID=2664436 RepID=UPI003529ABB8
MRCRLASLTVSALLVLASLPAGASELPKRKSGLWEITTRMQDAPAGMPGAMPMQICVDQGSDNLLQERSRRQSNCPKLEVSRSGGKLLIHAVCQHEGTTVTSDSVISGDLEKQYRNEMNLRYDPPQRGMREMRMTQEARWLGPCQSGQKPGEMVLPGQGGGNLQELMNDPRVKEMMKRQQGTR